MLLVSLDGILIGLNVMNLIGFLYNGIIMGLNGIMSIMCQNSWE